MVRTGIAALALLTVAVACTETRRSLGEDCLKDDDCLSGFCSQLQCSAPPQLLDGSILPQDASPQDASSQDASPPVTDAADGSRTDANEAAPPMDAALDR